MLPVGAEEYDQGYGLDRLRELTLVELAGPRAMNGTHLYDSLARLFTLVDQGHEPPEAKDGEQDGLVFHSLRADLFLPKATALIDETGLGNAALQRVLRHLLLSKEARGKDRGFISYAELGINQLGAVYEGLMSYTGFFAETDLYEVAKDGDPSKGSWVVPVERADGIAEKDFVRVEDEVTGERKAVLHERGTFVFRLAGRERQQSASYYTPEVLTRFTVSQALEELLDQDGHTTTAEEILGLTVCEPALGSGAFAIEAVGSSPSSTCAAARPNSASASTRRSTRPNCSGSRRRSRCTRSTAWTSTRPPWNWPRSRSGWTRWCPGSRRRGSACGCAAATP